ncbi:rhomboid family intramembrane serine protease [Arsenicitalea aurantiaca]|uniref:Rhomboid family intramembrane serine protease n=1 Tax=Arsenicitalea aurantiaca TaxID=1783274 RepID=A0A433X5N9_9HYPH|nr:rhomboid family intramembrane serine protease [Arsenicitalea aurantiaca]RUT29406.1 rhomboid family intramembrane serine protease [Arsenicitalea aurantiaca]
MFLPLHDRNPIKHVDFPYVTYGLIGVTTLVFLFQSILPPAQFDDLVVAFGMIPVVVSNQVTGPAPWLPDQLTLLTYAFLHADWMHLLFNMLFLWVFGDNIEDALGHVRFLVFYLLCAALAGLAHMAFDYGGFGPLIGASGAVAGVMGAYLVLYPHARVYVLFRLVIPIPLPVPAFWMLGAWIGTQLFYVLVGSDDGVSWWAHLGGIAAGALLVVPMRRRGIALFGGR